MTQRPITLPALPTFMTTNLCGAMQEWCDADMGDDAAEAFEHVVTRFGHELRRYAHAAVEADRAENNYERGYADGLASRADIARLQQEIDTLRSDREAGRSAPVAWGRWCEGLPPATRLMRYDGAPDVRFERSELYNVPLYANTAPTAPATQSAAIPPDDRRGEASSAVGAEPVNLAEPDEEMCQKLAALGWQKIVCGMCGHDGARGYPRAATPLPSEPLAVAASPDVGKMVEEAKRLGDELSMADGARSIPTGELYRGITQSQYAAKRQELHTSIDALEAAATQARGGEAVAERLKTLAHNVDEMCRDALRIPYMPWPDPHAHSADAYHRAVHRSFCDLRFKLMDIRKEANAAQAPAAPQPPKD